MIPHNPRLSCLSQRNGFIMNSGQSGRIPASSASSPPEAVEERRNVGVSATIDVRISAKGLSDDRFRYERPRNRRPEGDQT